MFHRTFISLASTGWMLGAQRQWSPPDRDEAELETVLSNDDRLKVAADASDNDDLGTEAPLMPGQEEHMSGRE
jgi:hypothetical protein